jgi:hypothetical protein
MVKVTLGRVQDSSLGGGRGADVAGVDLDPLAADDAVGSVHFDGEHD